LGRGFTLKQDLGNWIRKDCSIWRWYFAPTLDSIIHLTERNKILVHKRFSAISYKNKFSPTGIAITTLPTPLLKASVKLTKGYFLWLIDTGTFENPFSRETYYSIYEYIDSTVTQNLWCYDNMTVPNDYSPLLQDIRNGDTYMVCDGSFHPTYKRGAAAWIIEGKTSKQQTTGTIISPGRPNEQSAYRSKLAEYWPV
jgi:hypothetical protein